jgi:hypothetical protein
MYKKEQVTLTKNNNQYTLQINNSETFKNYTKWVSDNLLGEMSNNKSFNFKAEYVININDLLKKEKNELSYKQCKTIFLNLGNQLLELKKDGYGIFQINKNDIFFICFENSKCGCIFLNIQDCNPVVDDEYEVMFPFDKEYLYNSPEILEINELPSKFLYLKSLFYSLAIFVCDCLKKLDKNYKLDNIEKHIECILGTKLYWSLLRCLEPYPYDRYFLFI